MAERADPWLRRAIGAAARASAMACAGRGAISSSHAHGSASQRRISSSHGGISRGLVGGCASLAAPTSVSRRRYVVLRGVSSGTPSELAGSVAMTGRAMRHARRMSTEIFTSRRVASMRISASISGGMCTWSFLPEPARVACFHRCGRYRQDRASGGTPKNAKTRARRRRTRASLTAMNGTNGIVDRGTLSSRSTRTFHCAPPHKSYVNLA